MEGDGDVVGLGGKKKKVDRQSKTTPTVGAEGTSVCRGAQDRSVREATDVLPAEILILKKYKGHGRILASHFIVQGNGMTCVDVGKENGRNHRKIFGVLTL